MLLDTNKIVNLISEKLKSCPIKVLGAALYGSVVKGTFTKDSDIDLLIISKEINPVKHKRHKEVAKIKEHLSLGIPVDILLLTPEECISNFKNHNPLFLDISTEGIIILDEDNFLEKLFNETKEYIEKRKIQKLTDGWRFPVKYREVTYLSEISNKDFALSMLKDGERDFKIGETLIKEGFFDKAVYHFQQASEKAIKAILICFGEFKKTHFVGEILLNILKIHPIENDWIIKLEEIAKISLEIEPEVTWSRYPGIDEGKLWIPYEEYKKEDADEVREKAEKIVHTAKNFVIWWFNLEKT